MQTTKTTGAPCGTCGFTPTFELISVGDLLATDREVLQARDAQYLEHVRHTTRTELATTKLSVLRRRHDVSPIRVQFGSWAVTTYGLECLVSHYAIEKGRLHESDWQCHMLEKNWVLPEDLIPALAAARGIYPQKTGRRQSA
jgi:hypothetical protein